MGVLAGTSEESISKTPISFEADSKAKVPVNFYGEVPPIFTL
jgi:hypothetical protein